MASDEYATAKISVWWDIENCQVANICDPHCIANNIHSSLVNLGYCGPISISAYGDTNGIPEGVQKGINSTGIALNHVPAGVKDASDKKILVDMLFWAVDNAAPANYLLISGDRDFSNALHQLRMRKYNILLAQPQRASPPLVAAASSVWLWTSLLAGGPPLSKNDVCPSSNSDNLRIPVSEPAPISKPIDSSYENSYSLQKSPSKGRVEFKAKGKQIQKKVTQSYTPETSIAPTGVHEDNSNVTLHQPSNINAKQYHEPHDLSHAHNPRPMFSGQISNGTNGNSPRKANYNQSSLPIRPNNSFSIPTFRPGNMLTPDPHIQDFNSVSRRAEGPLFNLGFPTNIPDLGKLKISGSPKKDKTNSSSKSQNATDQKNSKNFKSPNHVSTSSPQGQVVPNSQLFHNGNLNNIYSSGTEFVPLSSATMGKAKVSAEGMLGSLKCPRPSDYLQGLGGVVLIALNTLKNEKIMPTEINIADCIRYGDLKNSDIDFKKALEVAVQQQIVIKQKLGALQFYIGKNDKLWHCVNPLGGNPNEYPKAKWDKIQKFLASTGKSAISASRCRYEAAIIMKKMCLKKLSLGDIIHILHLVVSAKKWITHMSSGWQPLNITVPETSPNLGSVPGT